MNLLNKPELDGLIRRAITEDVGQGDITTAATVAPGQRGRARIVVKEPKLVFCGGFILRRVLEMAGAEPEIIALAGEGAPLAEGEVAAELQGLMAGLLVGERTALNFIQLMTGIATLTRQFVDAVAGTRAVIVDTRKTHPGLRALEKYAVRTAGGQNHRFGLDGGVLIKDNHIAAAGSVGAAIERTRRLVPHTFKIEIECETVEQVEQACKAGAEIILLDNMPPRQMRQARALTGDSVILEASGGVTLNNVREIAESGVDLISVGALTHSARAADLSMKIESER